RRLPHAVYVEFPIRALLRAHLPRPQGPARGGQVPRVGRAGVQRLHRALAARGGHRVPQPLPCAPPREDREPEAEALELRRLPLLAGGAPPARGRADRVPRDAGGAALRVVRRESTVPSLDCRLTTDG